MCMFSDLYCMTLHTDIYTWCINKQISGIVPIAEAKTVCAGTEKFVKMCESNEVRQK